MATSPDQTPAPTARTRVAFLRGINVGGVTVPMARLRAVFVEVGLVDARTVLATGNVVFTSDEDRSDLESRLSSAIGDEFGYDAVVFVVDRSTLAEVVAAYPFDESDDRHGYVVVAPDPEVRAALSAVPVDADVERVAEGDGVVYWTVPRGSTLSTPFGKALGRKAFRVGTTNRNLTTMRKLL